jgi:DinB family protein/activator of Hsp90 ATPase-like protein
MTSVTEHLAPVRKSVTVTTSVEHAFAVFTEGFDTWWPRSHHVGESPLGRAVIEGRVGGRCYGRSVDGTECPWGRITVWEPPRRFAFAWMLDGEWKYNPDLSHASEVDVTFTALDDRSTRVDLEHRHFERHGASGAQVRTGVSSPNGWADLLRLYAATAAPAPAAPLRPVLAPIALQLKLNGGLMKSALDGLSPADWWHRPTERTNPILWIFGHVVATRASLAGMLGDPIETGWDKKFARGAELLPAEQYPPVQEIERVNRDAVDRLKQRFAALTDDELGGPPTVSTLPGVTTLAEQLAFFAFHESYHVGQMAYVRKSLGHSRVAG